MTKSRVRSAAATATLDTAYSAQDRAIVGHNQRRFFNRPLYVAHTDAFVLAGDRPVIRFASGEALHGTLCLGVVRGRTARWLHTFANVSMEYRGAHVRWRASDPALRGLEFTLEVVAREDEVAMAVRLEATGARRGDQLVWSYGGAQVWPGKPLNWELDPHRLPPLAPEWFDPAVGTGNAVALRHGAWTVAPAGDAGEATFGRCDAGVVAVRDSSGMEDPASLLAEGAGNRPVVAGVIDLAREPRAHWSVRRTPRAIPDATPAKSSDDTPARAFEKGLERSASLAGRIVVETPEPRLDAVAAVLPAAKDGAWYPPLFRHGSMLWNVRYPGWRTLFGATVLGWHDRVKAQAKFYAGAQVKSGELTSTDLDPAVLLTVPAKHSLFYGRGRVLEDQGLYNMQSQLFDQLIHAWRWTGDAELAAVLRPALDLHLEWLRECFDPDDDGLYESVINVWPTDSVWYAGGGATEETSYAWRAHTAAEELARRAGDLAAARRHGRQADRIRAAFRRKLWIARRGHAGLYREQDGLRRLHDDPWLYSIFLPIDAGLVDTRQAAQSLRFAERGLQNDAMLLGGRMVWTSNFVPGIWSVRERWAGDNHHLALAYFQAGLGEDGWEIFRGTFLHTAFGQGVPGDLGAPMAGTDFGDSTDPFARTLVEGLFGIVPDRPAGVVRITPQLPAEWKRARLRTPDAELLVTREGETTTLNMSLAAPARLIVRLPVCAAGVAAVEVDGKSVRWRAEPGFGRTFIGVHLPETRVATVVIRTKGSRAAFRPIEIAGPVGGRVVLRTPAGAIRSWTDPERVLTAATMRRGAVVARLAANPGAHTLFARVRHGTLPQWTRFHLEIADPRAKRIAAALELRRAPARAAWKTVALGPALNGDIRTIFQQKYLTPRPPTISVRIGTDGYSPWTFLYWSSYPPVIALDGVPGLQAGAPDGCLRTPQGVPFAWPGEARNVAFTSRWDNWPGRVTVPIGQRGDAVWFLACGSTNPMQGKIANAVLRLRYARGPEDRLELVPPFNYWNLCPIRPMITAPGQESRTDYTAATDAFCMPAVWPETVQLGENCRAMVLGRRLRRGEVLRSVTLETLSAEVVVGLMGVTLMNPR